MALSVFESSKKYLGLVPVIIGGGGPAGGGSLPFQMQHQLQTQWCWAAVTASTAAYYASNGGWTQCKVVNALLQQAVCCASGNSTACNQPFYLDRALSRTGNLSALTTGKLSLGQVWAEIDAGRPIGVRIGWGGGGGHFVALSGYFPAGYSPTGYSTTGRVQVQDPWFGPSSTDYLAFSTRYQGFGSWTHTYRTVGTGTHTTNTHHTVGEGASDGHSTTGTSTWCLPIGRASPQ